MVRVATTAAAAAHGEISWSAWREGFGAATQPSVRYRYAVAKARRFVSYTTSTSTARHLAVVCMYLLPGLLASLIPPFVVLQDPTLGALRNSGFFIHGALTTLATFGGGMLQARAVTMITHHDISTLQVAAIAVVGTVLYWVVMGLLGIFWRFPVPFTMVLGAAPYVVSLIGAVVLVVRPRDHVRTRLLVYIPSHVGQVSQILFYPIYTTLFEATGQGGQIVLIALFPVSKYYLKRAVAAVSYHLGDFRREVAVAGVEICASIYQATIMQNTPSILSGVLIVVVDMVQGLIDVRRFLSTDPAAFARALVLLQDNTREIVDGNLDAFASPHVGLLHGIRAHTRCLCTAALRGASVRAMPTSVVPAGPVLKRNRPLSNEDTTMRELTQALEVLQSMETILLIEYLETLAPVVNVAYLVVASQLQSAVFNPRLRAFYGDGTALTAAVVSVAVYSLLQAATLAAMCLLIRRRFQLSALGLLAYVLETHVWSLQAKMVAWFSFMFAFSVVHYGVDFSFKFDFHTPLPSA